MSEARCMTRPSNPGGIHEARATAAVQRIMVAFRLTRETAELWVAAWHLEASERRLDPADGTYWPDGEAWIAAQRGAGNPGL